MHVQKSLNMFQKRTTRVDLLFFRFSSFLNEKKEGIRPQKYKIDFQDLLSQELRAPVSQCLSRVES